MKTCCYNLPFCYRIPLFVRTINVVRMSWKILEKAVNFRKQNPGLEKFWKNRMLRNAPEKSWKI